MRRTLFVWLVVLSSTLLGACGDGAEVSEPVAVALTVSPASLSFTDADTVATLFLTTTPSGGRLEWRTSGAPSWLELSPDQGVIDGEVVEVQVTARGLAESSPGTATGTIDLVSDGGAAAVSVMAEVPVRRILEASPAEVDLGVAADTGVTLLRNGGNVAVDWSATPQSPWLSIAPSSGTIGVGDSVEVVVRADRTDLPVGANEGTIRIDSNADVAPSGLTVMAEVEPEPFIRLDPLTVYFDTLAAERSLSIENTGTAALEWSASASAGWLSVTPSSGTVAAGGATVVTVEVDQALVPGGQATSQLTLATNTERGSVDVPVKVGTGYDAGLHVLRHRVVDAEYTRERDLIVSVSADPAQLHVIDPRMATVLDVDLSLSPTAVSVSPDGTRAAVGHDGYVSVVDFSDPSSPTVDEYPVDTEAIDVVLASNGWVYVFPIRDQWESIRGIELATGTVTNSGGWSIYAGTVARLHPSGDFMYGANRGLSPSDFEKYDIRGGTPEVLYDSPYHGDYAFGGDIWIADDGKRLFARSGNVFHASTVQAEDMIYAGSLDGVSYAAWIEHSTAANRILALQTGRWGDEPALEIQVYGAQYLDSRGTAPLPPFTNPATEVDHDSHGRFVFVGSSGEDVYALVRADPAAGLARDWALVVMPASDLP